MYRDYIFISDRTIIFIIIIISRLPSHIGVSLFVFDYFLNLFSFSIWPIRLSSIIGTTYNFRHQFTFSLPVSSIYSNVCLIIFGSPNSTYFHPHLSSSYLFS
jgi:hypothetical protein